jgi:hypothetical protein
MGLHLITTCRMPGSGIPGWRGRMELPILRCRKEGEGHAKKLYAWPRSRCRLLTGVFQISTHGAIMLHVRHGANGRVEGGVAGRQAEVWAKGGVLDSWTKVRVQHWTRRGNIRSRRGTAGEAMNVWMGLADGQNPEERNFCSLTLPLSKENVIICSLGVKQCKVWPIYTKKILIFMIQNMYH